MKKNETPETPETPKSVQAPILTSDRALSMARGTSRMAAICSILAALLTLFSIVASSYLNRSRNAVAAIPVGEVWEYPMVHWMNMPTRYEEDAKPLHVAMKYVRALYEVDPLDFSEVSASGFGARVMLSNRVAELLSYTIPGTTEYLKVSSALERSQALFQTYTSCRCLKRFLVSDMMVYQPPLPSLRVELIGRFVIFGQDGIRPLPAEDLGYKSIVIHMSNDIPLYDRGEAMTGRGLRAENPEGWYVIKSQITTLSQNDLDALREIRADTNMKGAL